MNVFDEGYPNLFWTVSLFEFGTQRTRGATTYTTLSLVFFVSLFALRGQKFQTETRRFFVMSTILPELVQGEVEFKP